MTWTPELGATALACRLGRQDATALLTLTLTGDVTPDQFVAPPYRAMLLDIGDGHAERLLADDTGQRLVYWPQVWAARALAYIGGDESAHQLARATTAEHWRVRMTATQTIGRLGLKGQTMVLCERLSDGNPRVRSAAILALERVGTDSAVQPLSALLSTDVRRNAERALETILDRTD